MPFPPFSKNETLGRSTPPCPLLFNSLSKLTKAFFLALMRHLPTLISAHAFKINYSLPQQQCSDLSRINESMLVSLFYLFYPHPQKSSFSAYPDFV